MGIHICLQNACSIVMIIVTSVTVAQESAGFWVMKWLVAVYPSNRKVFRHNAHLHAVLTAKTRDSRFACAMHSHWKGFYIAHMWPFNHCQEAFRSKHTPTSKPKTFSFNDRTYLELLLKASFSILGPIASTKMNWAS